jgi:oligosaccharide 4-alpha-D-glucosyltransferase
MGERDPELYRRWLQMAVFSPIFRPHGSVSAPDPNIAQIESEPVFYDDPDKSIIRNFIELRYRLMPYVYNLAYESAKTGAPFVRPLFFNDTSDSNLYKANDQYYFGNALLVAPVLEKGAKTRKVYLPYGQWYDFWNPSAIIYGGRWLEVKLTAEQIPVFVKAGSVLPMKPLFNNTNEYPKDQLEWHYYPKEGSHSYTIYEDDGQTAQSLSSGAYEIIRVHAETRAGKHKIRFASNAKIYHGKPASREVKWILHGQQAPPKIVLVDGKSVDALNAAGNDWGVMIKDWKDQSVEIKAE